MTNTASDHSEGASVPDQALVNGAASVSTLSGFDPSRGKRPSMATRLREFEAALFDERWIAERVLAGQQFNAWECTHNDDADDPDDWEYTIGLGPVGDVRFICDVTGEGRAHVIEAAMKVATEALLERPARDSDTRPKDGDEGNTSAPLASSADLKGIAHD